MKPLGTAESSAVTIATATVRGVAVVEPDPAQREAIPGAWFDHRRELGRGYKYLPQSAMYALAATRRVLADAESSFDTVDPERRAIFMGTNNAVSVVQGDIDRTIAERGSHVLSPAAAPYFSINLIGSRVAMEHSIKGFSLGFHTPRTAGLEALQFGASALAGGRADIVLAGVAEEPLDSAESGAPGQDGAVVFALGAATENARHAIASCSLFLPPSARNAETVDAELHNALRSLAATGTSGETPAQVVLAGPDCAVTSAVHDALIRDHTSDVELHSIATAGSFQPVRVLVDLLNRPTPGRRIVVATSEYGNVALTQVRTR